MINEYDWTWYCDIYGCKNNNSRQEIYVCSIKNTKLGLCKTHLNNYKNITIDYLIEIKEKKIMNKEKLINELRTNIYLGKIGTCCAENIIKIINKIKNGEFD